MSVYGPATRRVRACARFGVRLGACLLASCVLTEQRYAVENEAVALTADTAPAFVTEDDDEIFIVNREFELPITPPKNADLNRLTSEAEGRGLPFPRLPWVESGDLELELAYTLANQGDDTLIAGLILNGRNEFNVYTPAALDFNQWERRFELGPKERVSGVISELELDEIAVDLATVVNGAPVSNLVVHFQSQSGRDERVAEYIPDVVPGLVGLTAGIMTTQAANVVLEISIRAQDHGDRLAKRGEQRWELPEPTPFVPVVVDEDEE
jgi:hypothetical protein